VRALGIPYATAARFGTPEPVPFDRAGTYDAFGPGAPQPLDSPLGEIVPGMGVATTDEHACLTLNVFAPDGARELPVLVWFHGGSFVIGASSQPVYDGTLLAIEQQVVVVSVNYRLGALGFLDGRPIGGVANGGVRDALSALEWARDNAARFGGDPARIVAFGESAGGGLLLHALASGRLRGLLAGAIVQSGATFTTFDTERAALVRETLIREAGLADAAGLTTLSVDALIKAQSTTMTEVLPIVGMMPYHPMIDGDVIHARVLEALRGGAAAGIPLICGTTADEMALFVGKAPAPSRDRLVRRVDRYLRASLHKDEGEGETVVAHYARALGTDDAAAIWRAFFGDFEMQAPARAIVDAQRMHAPTFTYLFEWGGPEVGSCHGIDIPFPFGNFGDGWDTFVGLDDAGRALGRRVRDAWAAFARVGDPGWPEAPPAMVFGRDPHVAPEHPLFARLPFAEIS